MELTDLFVTDKYMYSGTSSLCRVNTNKVDKKVSNSANAFSKSFVHLKFYFFFKVVKNIKVLSPS